MAERGLSSKETARRVREQLPGEKFSPAHVAVYRQGRAIPRPRYLDALSLALGVEPADLVRPPEAADPPPPTILPSEGDTGQGAETPASSRVMIQLKDSGPLVRIDLSMDVPWDAALAILKLLRGVSGFPESSRAAACRSGEDPERG